MGVNLIVGDPVGEFDHFVGAGFGADFFGRLPMDPRGVLSLRGRPGLPDLRVRVEAGLFRRGWVPGPGSSCKPPTASSSGGSGRSLAIPMRRARPYVHAFMGFAYFNTTSSLEDLVGRRVTISDGELRGRDGFLGSGGGLEWNLQAGPDPHRPEPGVRYHQNGVMEYLTEGDIVDNPDGSITLYPIRSEANLVSYHFGVSVGIPRGRGRPSRASVSDRLGRHVDVQIFGIQKSADTRKALRFFKERRVTVHFVDLKIRAASKGELTRFVQKFGVDAILDRESKRFQALGLGTAHYSDKKWLELLAEEPLLLKMPLVRNQNLLSRGAGRGGLERLGGLTGSLTVELAPLPGHGGLLVGRDR